MQKYVTFIVAMNIMMKSILNAKIELYLVYLLLDEWQLLRLSIVIQKSFQFQKEFYF
jgi:hypothetical protein